MSSERRLFTSESVTGGHPDKVADQISDSILDAMLSGDPHSRVACETLVTTGLCVIAGEVTTKAQVDLQRVVRGAIARIGYTDPALGFSADSCGVAVSLDQQSPDISQGVTAGEGLHKEQGAGDQGLMFGYACNETPVLMPAPIHYAHRLCEALTRVREDGSLPWVRPDGKSQVTAEYGESGNLERIDTVVISTQHAEDVDHETLVREIREKVIGTTIPAKLLDDKTMFHINPTGRFVIGGPKGDCGLTGRKIIVDTYGGMGRHGGGAFSGKDPSKVDRSATYAARWVAKNIVASGIADRCEVQLAYAIGVAQPVSVHCEMFGTGKLPEDRVTDLIREHFDLRPAGIIEQLDLLHPIYTPTAALGHFGREDATFTWEQTTRADALRSAAGL